MDKLSLSVRSARPKGHMIYVSCPISNTSFSILKQCSVIVQLYLRNLVSGIISECVYFQSDEIQLPEAVSTEQNFEAEVSKVLIVRGECYVCAL